MQELITNNAFDMEPVCAVIREPEFDLEDKGRACEPLWLTPREAEALLVLCVASPVSAGSGEHDLFMKLGDFFRFSRRSR